MPGNLFGIDGRLSTYDGKGNVKEQLRGLYNDLYQLRESLQYAMGHLGRENFQQEVWQQLLGDPEAMQALEQRVARLEQQVQALQEGGA